MIDMLSCSRPARNSRKRLVAAAAVLALAAAAAFGCARSVTTSQADGRRGRVLILGIDGTAPRLVKVWMSEGKLPNLRSLAEQGSSGRIRGDEVILSPRIWTSVATGKSPALHGIKAWVLPGNRLYQGSDRRGAALWTIASAAGLRVATVNWLATHPPEKIDGVVISELAQPGRSESLQNMGRRFGWDGDPPREYQVAAVWPPEWQPRVAEIAEGVERAPDSGAFARPLLRGIREDDELAARLALRVEREIRPDLLMVLLQGNDRISHFNWCGVVIDPERYPEERRPRPVRMKRAGEEMLAYYRYTDSLVGRLLERFGPDDLVIVLSDHGFEPAVGDHFDPGVSGTHDSARARDGVLFVRGPGIPAGGTFDTVSVEDVTPTVLAWLGLPVGRDMTGRVLPFLKTDFPDTVDTYDDLPIERLDVDTDALEERIVTRLKSLGYLH
ncbi:MAG TPA: alkaline phosphatase family protein [bacterium]|nr:alkaline phosphatase family protein [bacterium]